MEPISHCAVPAYFFLHSLSMQAVSTFAVRAIRAQIAALWNRKPHLNKRFCFIFTDISPLKKSTKVSRERRKEDIIYELHIILQRSKKTLDISFLLLGLFYWWVELFWDQAWGFCWSRGLGQNLYFCIITTWVLIKSNKHELPQHTNAGPVCRNKSE